MSKKVLSLVLALVMVLGTFGTAFAANYPDTVDTVYDGAVDRLSLLEILKGYPDGTFKPENQITRAEFAAVAVRAKGLEDAANAAKGLATGFTDVAPAPAHWAAGYVGTAARLGIVNGVGGGLFAPEAPVKYEEAITMIVRALGYEVSAQTKGGYPYGYLIVANEIGLLDQVKGTQGTPASRGTVAQITDNALEIPKMIQVGFGADAKWVVSGSKEHGDEAEAQYLLHDLGVEEVKGFVTNNFRTKSTVKADEVEIDGVKYDIAEGVDTDAVLGVGVTAWAKDDVVFSITLGHKIKTAGKDIVFNKDQVLYDAIVAKDTNEDEAYLYKLDDEYDWAKKARIFVNNEDVKAEEIPNNAYGRFVLNEEDEIEFAYLFDIAVADTGLVTKITKTDLEYVNLNADEDVLELDDAEEIYVFNKDLSAASLEDIKENTAVFYWIDSDDNYYIVALNETLEGTLEAVRVRDSRITVEGTNVKFEEKNSIFSVDGEDFEVLVDFESIEEYVDEEVAVYYNLVGDTLALVTDVEATTSKVYGLATWLTSARNPVLSVYTSEDKEVDYTFEDRDDALLLDGFGLGTSGKYAAVYFEINKDGEIKEDSLKVVAKADEGEFSKQDDKKYGSHTKVPGSLYITEDTVIIKALNSKGEVKPSVIKYGDIINKEILTVNSSYVMKVANKGNDLGLLVFTNKDFQATDDTEYGIITSDPTVRGTLYRAEIDVVGKGKETYTLSSAANSLKLRTGDLISFKLNDKGEVVNVSEIKYRAERDNASVYETVSSKSGSFITTNKDTYRNLSNTVIYSVNKAGDVVSASSFGRIAKDSVLLLKANSDDELKVVLDITAYREGKTDSTGGTLTGVVTYIDATKITIDGKDYKLDQLTVYRPLSGSPVIGGASIVGALNVNDLVNIDNVVNGVVTSLTQLQSEASKLSDAQTAVGALETAVGALDATQAKNDAAVTALTAAKTSVAKLAAGTDKTALEVRIATAETAIKANQKTLSTTAVGALETAVGALDATQAKNDAAVTALTAAKTSVAKMAAGTDKTALEVRIATAETAIKANQKTLDNAAAATAVGALETAVSALDATQAKNDAAVTALTAAKTAVAKMDASAQKTSLEARIAVAELAIEANQKSINEAAAVVLVNAAADKFDMRTAINENLEALGMTAITLEQADYLFVKRPAVGRYTNAAAIIAELANY